MKKLLSVFLALIMVFSLTTLSFAGFKEEAQLQFDENGKFKILVLADVQTGYPVPEDMKNFIRESIRFSDPDLVVFTGDNINNEDVRSYDDVFGIVEKEGVPFTAVLGNHDQESSGGLTRDEIIAKYQEYDGCLAYDADPALHGAGTHNLPILSSDGSKVAFNLWMFDCGDYVRTSSGEWLGYDWVREDQIEWYNTTRDAMTAENGGEVVPSLVFQHIIPQEPTQMVFPELAINAGELTINFQDGTSNIIFPDISKFKDGYGFEMSCPSYGNDGQWDAMVQGGDVLGVVVGHDHVNNFIVDCNGIDLIMTPGCTFSSYYNNMIQGARVIEIDENNPTEYSSYTLTATQLAREEDSLLGYDRSEFDYTFSYYFEKIFAIIHKIFQNILGGGNVVM